MYNKHQQAVQYALVGNWELAVEQNLAILDEVPDNLASLNRLARAYTELGQKDAAKTVYQKVLEIDKYNPIALKNLKLLPHQKVGIDSLDISKEDFIEELGLTKAVLLIKVADRATLLSLVCKQLLKLTPKARLMALMTMENVYVGCLPDDLSLKLKSLIDHGYVYTVCLKTASDNTATVFIREIKRPSNGKAVATFSKAMLIPIKKAPKRKKR